MQTAISVFAEHSRTAKRRTTSARSTKSDTPARWFAMLGEDGRKRATSPGGKLSNLDGMDLSVSGDSEHITLLARFDNLGKGASGARFSA
jgi:hypothetical protein